MGNQSSLVSSLVYTSKEIAGRRARTASARTLDRANHCSYNKDFAVKIADLDVNVKTD